ncbi:5-aminolevulinate synthase [Xenorhabdus bovienii]|uniref:5-aminolevulinate synthase n=1 Tax=Xenorhabdus bovienii str. feltiae Moldova TaxID=1398200 RepID=A0A077NV27_XENBV|nr:5-aminolevulinate synthase [Xenorhabdus bovienii]MCG3468871.1 5-aminolevulinate synthase [Xenorhabdus bovienii]CDH02339.1 5-aminolevulinate synthase [Xenorhabdus bovienii str. feltiae Moldova]
MYQKYLRDKLEKLKLSGQYRNFTYLNRICGQYPLAQLRSEKNKSVVVWCSNDYLGMSENDTVLQEMHKAIDRYGAGSGGSRNISGSYEMYEHLESELAQWHKKEAALVFPTGFTSNDATIQCLLRLFPELVVISDELNHASIVNGIRATKNNREIFQHNDIEHLEQILKKYPYNRPKIIIFESVYSMDGDISPVEEIISLAKKYNSLTYLDEVHAVGIYGPEGAGIAAERNISEQIDIIQGTMAKSIGIIGGYIASSNEFIDSIRSFSTGFIFTTSLPPSVTAGCLASIRYIKENNYLREQLYLNTSRIRVLFKEKNIPLMAGSQTHILPVMIGNAQDCRNAAERLLQVHSIYIQPINYPSVPIGTERFRINATPNHTLEQIEQLADAVQEVFQYLNIYPFINKTKK